MTQVNLDVDPACRRHAVEPVKRQFRRRKHRPPHKHGIGDLTFAAVFNNGLGAQEITIRARWLTFQVTGR